MITMTEKIKLAKDVGAVAFASKQSRVLSIEKQIQELTNLKFKVTNHEKIKGMISSMYWSVPSGDDLAMAIGIGHILLGTLVAFASLLPFIASHALWTVRIPFVAVAVFEAGCFKFCTMKLIRFRTDIIVCSLSQWEDNLPYGALLAVKEAQERGLDNFKIHYPVKNHYERVLADPVITGEKNGIMCEVFAWDDGKVYE